MTTSDLRQVYRNEELSDSLLALTLRQEKSILVKALADSQSPKGEAPAIRASVATRLDLVCDAFLPAYVRADQLAIRYQTYHTRGAKSIFILAAFAVYIVSAQFLFELPGALVYLEVLAMVAILGIIGWGNRIGWQRRWMDYRLLAERLRTALFMTFIGEELVSALPQNDFYREPPEAWWGSKEFAAVWAAWEGKAAACPRPEGPASVSVLRKFLRAAWVDEQASYHGRTSERHRRRHHLYSSGGEALFFLTIVAALLHALHVGGHGLGALWTFLAIVFPVTGSAFAALRAHFEHNRLARRSRAMAMHLEEASAALERADTAEALKRVARTVETLILEESSRWRVTIWMHPLEPPA